MTLRIVSEEATESFARRWFGEREEPEEPRIARIEGPDPLDELCERDATYRRLRGQLGRLKRAGLAQSREIVQLRDQLKDHGLEPVVNL